MDSCFRRNDRRGGFEKRRALVTQWMSMNNAGRQDQETMLGPYRVLDLTDEKGLICGKTLADLGADVIQIEPPGGSSARDLGPFYRDMPSGEESLYWFAYNANKRSITLNLESSDGQDMFKKLVAKADFVIESFPPGLPGHAWASATRR